MNDMNIPEITPEQNNTVWLDDATTSPPPAPKKRKIAVYGAAAAAADTLPILDRLPINTSIEDIPPPNTTPQYDVLMSTSPLPEGSQTVEGFDVEKEAEKAKKNPFQWVMKTVMHPIKICAQFKPKIITHNKYTDQFLEYLAGKDIANDWLDRASVFAEKNKDILRAEKLKSLVEKVKGKVSKKVGDVTDQLGDGLKKVCKGEADGGTNTTEGGKKNGGTEGGKNGEKEGFNGKGGETIKNPTLALDKALVKDYMFRTIILLVSFITVHSWAYLLLVAYGDKSNWIERLIQESGSSMPDISGLPFSSTIVLILTYLYGLYVAFNPFDMTTRGIKVARHLLENVAKTDMNDKYDKKIWFVVIFYATFAATTFFIENYDYYMHGVVNFKPNAISGAFYGLFVCLYLWDVITYIPNPNNWKEIGAILIFQILGLLYMLLKNIYVLVCLYYNQHTAVFVILMTFIIHSLGSFFMYPSIDPSKLFERFQKLKTTIKKDVEEKIALEELDPMPSIFTKIYRLLRSGIHFVHDHLFFMTAMVWILYMYRVFDKELKYTNLRMNVFTILAVSIFLLIILKFVQLTFL